MNRANFLKEQEKNIQKKWAKTTFESNAPIIFNPNDKNKFFVTFPFPYMNGRLHLGHVFTILKADITARHHRTRGFNVLFPFGYHGTGIPIVAAANNLRKEFDSKTFDKQFDTMIKMGIDETEIKKFIDPNMWLEYFPTIASSIDLPILGCAIDYRRTFVTTYLNPWFGSFIEWQFSKLCQENYLKFGKKMVIYSETDNQPCSDAERISGVGVEISNLKIALINFDFGSVYVTYDPTVPENIIVRSKNFHVDQYNLSTKSNVLGDRIIMPKNFYRNYINQPACRDIIPSEILNIENDVNIIFLESFDVIDQNYGSGLYTSNLNLNWKNYYEPESTVISRSGDVCVVAETDQWYIMYDDDQWRKLVYNYVDNEMEFTDQVVKELILTTVEKSHPWPFSRTVGLGTKIPFDKKYVIDSLSDSTIYMAYYTVAHLINKIPVENMSNEVWDCIFFRKECPIFGCYKEILTRMQNEFAYWYPIDLRVSGKDLITNHLTMMLFNHMAIFGRKLMPKKIYANGHIMVNGEKMSKSKGNFITLYQAVEKYGSDVTRFVCATAGDDTNDGNFNEKETDTTVLSLYAEIQNWKKYDTSLMRKGQLCFTDYLHLITLNKILKQVLHAYDKMVFRDVVKYGFYELQNIRNKYNDPHTDVFHLFLQSELAIMSPIVPHWAEYMAETHNVPIKWTDLTIQSIKPDGFESQILIDNQYNNKKIEWLYDYCQIIMSKMSNVLKRFKKKKVPIYCKITMNNNMSHYLNEIINYDTADKNQRKILVSKYTNKNDITTVIELFTHLEKLSDFYNKNELSQWLCDDNSYGIVSYLTTQFSNMNFVVIYDNNSKADVLNPIFTLS